MGGPRGASQAIKFSCRSLLRGMSLSACCFFLSFSSLCLFLSAYKVCSVAYYCCCFIFFVSSFSILLFFILCACRSRLAGCCVPSLPSDQAREIPLVFWRPAPRAREENMGARGSLSNDARDFYPRPPAVSSFVARRGWGGGTLLFFVRLGCPRRRLRVGKRSKRRAASSSM